MLAGPHAVYSWEMDTETRCTFVLLEERSLVTEAEKQKSYAPLESQLGEARIREMLPDVEPSILSEGGMYP